MMVGVLNRDPFHSAIEPEFQRGCIASGEAPLQQLDSLMQPSLKAALRYLQQVRASPTQSIEHLERFQINWRIASDYLDKLLFHSSLLELYQELFPKEYRRSTANTDYQRGSHTEKEREFFELIDEHYFPLDSWLDEDELLLEIPLTCLNDDWWDVDLAEEGVPLIHRLTLACLMQDQWKEFVPFLPDVLQEIDAPVDQPHGLVERLKSMPPPVCHWEHVLKLLSYETGNIFLYHPDQYGDCESADWSKEAIDSFKQEYQEALVYFDYAQELDRWLTEDPGERIQVLVNVWNGIP